MSQVTQQDDRRPPASTTVIGLCLRVVAGVTVLGGLVICVQGWEESPAIGIASLVSSLVAALFALAFAEILAYLKGIFASNAKGSRISTEARAAGDRTEPRKNPDDVFMTVRPACPIEVDGEDLELRDWKTKMREGMF